MKKILFTLSTFACAVTGVIAVSCGKTETVNYKFDTLCADVAVADVTVKKGEEFTLPVPSSRGKEWEFAGWYTNQSFTGSPVTSAVADGAATYYAKWEQLYKLTLDLNGGSLSNADDLYLKAGANVSSYLAEYIPAKTGYEFGAWMNGTSEIGGAYRMPAQATTLSAKYKVGYTIDVWSKSIEYLRAEDKTGIDEYEKESVTLYAYAQTDFDVEYEMDGFYEVSHEGTVTNGNLVDNPQAGENHFVLYFDRILYNVRLNANVGENSASEVYQYYYNEKFDLPYDLYSNPGYVFAGWSESPTGENDYPIDFIDAVLYNKTGSDSSEVVRKPYYVSDDTTLYAYWNKGYSDMFGGPDTIFYLHQGSENIYLYRGGKYFKGEFVDPANPNAFSFYDKEDVKPLVEGLLLNDGMFCYTDENRGGDYRLFTRKDGVNSKIVLRVGSNNTLTYTEIDEHDVSSVARGTFTLDGETGEFTVKFDSGEGNMVGQTVKLTLGRVSTQNSSSSVPVFVICNEEERAMGQLARFAVIDYTLNSLRIPYYSIILDGYGNAVYYSGSNATQCSYFYNEEYKAYELRNSSNRVVVYAKYMEANGIKGYIPYNPEIDKTYEDAEGRSLTLDGTHNATYVDGGLVAKGNYSLSSTYFGGYLVSFRSGSTQYTFMLKANVTFDGITPVTTYTLERKLENYAEYYYYEGKNSQGSDAFYYPMLVLDDEAAGKANLYENVDGTLTKTAEGTYEENKDHKGLYLFTVENVFVDRSNGKFDITKISAFVFAIDTSNTSERVYYLYSQKDLETSETIHSKTYTDKDGATLTLVGGFAILTAKNDASTVTGTYETNDAGVTRITASGSYVFVEVTGEDTFVRYDALYGTAYLYNEDGTTNRYETMSFDGKGGATYTRRELETVDGENQYVNHAYVGTYTIDNGTFTFSGGEDGKGQHMDGFDFVIVTINNRNYFSILSKNAGEYTSDMGKLVLDGSGFEATYTDTFGNRYRSQYRVRIRQNSDGTTDNIVYIYANGEYLFFKLGNGHSFELIGNEFGSYLVIDNQVMDGRYLTLDGEGGYVMSQMADEKDPDAVNGLKVIAKGNYTKADDGVISFSYQIGSTSVAVPMQGRTGTISVNDSLYNAFFVLYDGIANTYVNEADYSVLILDDVGGATKHLQKGGMERGRYTLITDDTQSSDYNLLYYQNNAGTSASLYLFDKNTGLITTVLLDSQAYYNETLSSLLFTEYGFAIFNGTERCYYYQEANQVVVYRYAGEGVTGDVNDYGFVKEVISDKLGDEIVYKGSTYYKNGGYNVTFGRKAGEEAKYSVPGQKGVKYNLSEIIFMPTGSAEFSVSGKVDLVPTADSPEGTQPLLGYPCTVVRNLIKSESGAGDTDEMYLMIANFRFDIKVSYNQDKTLCTYTVNRMRFYVDADSYLYRYNVMMYAMLLGSTSAAEQYVPFFGHITIWQDYDENGDESGDMLMTGKFGETIQCLDFNKKTINFEAQPCVNNDGYFTVTVDHSVANGGDGYTYKGVFQLDSSLGVLTYRMASFCREQTFTQNVGGTTYEITVQRVITSEQQNVSPGRLYSLAIATVDGDTKTQIEANAIFNIHNVWNIIVRTVDPDTKKITSSVFYKIPMKEKAVSGEIDEDLVKPYESVSLEVITNVETVYSADGKSYVDVLDGEILCFRIGNSDYIVSESEYNAETQKYTATLYSGAQYEITIESGEDGKVATIVRIDA